MQIGNPHYSRTPWKFRKIEKCAWCSAHECQFNHEIDTYWDEIGCRILCAVPAETSRTDVEEAALPSDPPPPPSKVGPWGKFFSVPVLSTVSSVVKSFGHFQHYNIIYLVLVIVIHGASIAIYEIFIAMILPVQQGVFFWSHFTTYRRLCWDRS